MGLSGKYDFVGIKKLGTSVVRGALASNPKTAWVLKFGKLLDLLLEFLFNWGANNGLIFLNVAAFTVGGKIDQTLLDRAIEDGLKKAENPNSKLTPQQIKEIDDAVIRAARKAFPYSRKPYKP